VLALFAHQTSTLRDGAKTTGDRALIELSTMRAASGAQLLGPYSRFGFHHPGPLMFYCLAPFWAALGRSHAAQATGAVAVNLAALIGIAVGLRRLLGEERWPPALAALGLYLLWLQPAFLVSVWNPDIVVLPLCLALVAFAATAAGSLAWLPVAVVAGSFAVQSHIGCAVPVAVAAALAAVAAGARMRRLRRNSESPPLRWRRPVALAAGLGALVWLPVLIEQGLGRPGNVTLILRSVAERRDGQAWGATLRPLAVQMCSFLGSPFGLAARADASPRATLALVGAAAILLTLLLLAAVRGWRDSPGTSGLCLACLFLATAAVVAAHGIPGNLHPYLVRWVSALGVLGVIAVATAVIPSSAAAPPVAAWQLGVSSALIVATAALGVRSVVRFPATGEAAWTARADRLSDATLVALAAHSVRRPHVRIFGDHSWDPAAGIVLQCTKAGQLPTVDDAWLFMFGEPCRLRVADDGTLLVADRAVATKFAAIRGVEAVATAGDSSVFLVPGDRRLRGELNLGDPEAELYVRTGFSSAESTPDGGFRWSSGPESVIVLPGTPGTPHRLEVTASPFEVPDQHQEMRVSVNGVPIATVPMSRGRAAYAFAIPADLVRARNLVAFRYSLVRSPHELAGADDRRQLAVAFRAISFAPELSP
ncbi:MAG TPA: hypothetical protein VMT19_06010, partial [Thermoanaerobaculaceae bacterium]|nr:hypothetical protein [Thermoanaerobaculaceae bacterium]